MGKIRLHKINDEVVTALCWGCTCCLAEKKAHCWVCHSTIPIATLCGCGNCEVKVLDYIERERVVRQKVNLDNLAKANAVRTG